jgi:hypothetical protein
MMDEKQCERLLMEYSQLMGRICRLDDYLNRYAISGTAYDQELLEQQSVHMRNYCDVLERRIINLMIRGTQVPTNK